jgi:hypothetical protein
MSEDNAERASDLNQLRRSLRSLAAAGSEQPTLFPDDVVSADQLALDFGHGAVVVRGNYESDLSDEQKDALAALEQKLVTMSRDGAEFDAELWTDAALRTSEHWGDVRTLALSALEAFDWVTAPPSEDVSEPRAAVFGEQGE